MTTTNGVWRYLLRNGRFITASVQLAEKHLFRYVSKEGVVVFALLSSAAERLLMQLVDLSEAAANSPSMTRHCCITDLSLTSKRAAVKTPSPAHH